MRKIKFRGKLIETGEWVYGYYVKCRGKDYILEIRDSQGFDERWQEWAEVASESVGEFTGLKDQDGIEIYEKDILRSAYNQKDEYNCHPVEWNNGSWICKHQINDCCKPWRGMLSGHHRMESVIGNSLDNQKLLKSSYKEK